MEYVDYIYKKILDYEYCIQKSNLEKICQYFKNRKDKLKGPLKYEICLTNKCNQNCIHCSNGDQVNLSQIKTENIKHIISCEPICVVLTGGEPLLHPDICSIISMIKAHGIFLKICTNGVLLTEQICKLLEHMLDKDDIIQISFDAADEDTYRCIRGTNDFNLVCNNIHNARKILKNVTFEFHCVPNIYNVNQLTLIFKLAEKMKIDLFSTSPLAYLGRAQKEYQANIRSLLYIELVLHQMSNTQTRYVGRLFETCSLYGIIKTVPTSFQKESTIYRCDAGIFSIYIDCTEEIYPCVYLKNSLFCLGNCLENIQESIERAKNLFEFGHSINGSKCDNCYLWPYCNGGCIAMAYNMHGKLSPGLDPRCGRFYK